MSNIGQAWANLNDSDDENDDDDKTMIEAGKSDASLAYLALLLFLSIFVSFQPFRFSSTFHQFEAFFGHFGGDHIIGVPPISVNFVQNDDK